MDIANRIENIVTKPLNFGSRDFVSIPDTVKTIKLLIQEVVEEVIGEYGDYPATNTILKKQRQKLKEILK